MKIMKIAQEWYTKGTAQDTTDPEILTNILRKNNEDEVSWIAAKNPNCPPEALTEVLRIGKNDNVSIYTAKNPNCPPEALAEVLRRGKNDYVSYYAAKNPNCPPEILAEVLRRGKDDFVSECAAKNPNCSPEILAEILRRSEDDNVSQYAAENPNCPTKESIKWFKLFNKKIPLEILKNEEKELEKERKEREELEKSLTPEDKELLELLGENNQYKMKIAQETKKTQEAKGIKIETTFPTWLHKQIMEHTDDWTKNPTISQDDTNLIAEWAYTTKPDLKNFNLQDASTTASNWKIEETRIKAVKNYQTHDVVYKFKDGWEIVKLSYNDIPPENDLMKSGRNAPLGSMHESEYGQDYFIGDEEGGKKVMEEMGKDEFIIYSLRDIYNYPHATIEITANKNNLQILQIFAPFREGLKEMKIHEWTEYHHPYENKIKEFISWLKTQGYTLLPLGSEEDVKIKELSDTPLENEYGIPLSFWGIGGTEDNYYEALLEAFQEGVSGSYWYENSSFKAVDALIQYAQNNNELNLLQLAVEGYSIKTRNKDNKERTQYKGLEEWANESWNENEMYIEFENPRPDEDDYPEKENFMIPPDVSENQKEFPEMPESQPRFNEEAYNEALKEYQEAERAYGKELTEHQDYFEPLEFSNYVYKNVQEALKKQGKEEPQKEVNKKATMTTRIYKIAREEVEVPDAQTLALYTETLKSYIRDIPDLSEEIVEIVKSLPAPKKIRHDFSIKECEILFESIAYVWKKITGQKLIQEQEIINPPETLFGNYWLINNGILLHGVNHYGIIKQNASLLCALLKINGFALQEYLGSRPNDLIKFIIDNGGVRMFVNKNKKLYAQMSPETYGKWGRAKVKKYDFKLKAVKVIDLRAPYKGWKSGITIKL